MKPSIFSICAFLAFAPPIFADAAAPDEAALTSNLQLPVVIDGKISGVINVPSGRVVAVESVQAGQLLIDFAGAEAWVPRTATDFDQRLAASNEINSTLSAQDQAAFQQKTELAAQQLQQATADFQSKLDGYVSPLEAAPYDQTRSVVDYYDCWGNRYNIGPFGERIYN